MGKAGENAPNQYQLNSSSCTDICQFAGAIRGSNLPHNCIRLAYKFISYAELKGLFVSDIAWRMKNLQENGKR